MILPSPLPDSTLPLLQIGDHVTIKSWGTLDKFQVIGIHHAAPEECFLWLRWANGFGFQTAHAADVTPIARPADVPA